MFYMYVRKMRMTRAYLRIYSFNIKAGNSKTVLIINPINIG